MDLPLAKVFFRICVWLAVEILLNFLGLDNLADYSEFIFERNVIVWIASVKTIKAARSPADSLAAVLPFESAEIDLAKPFLILSF